MRCRLARAITPRRAHRWRGSGRRHARPEGDLATVAEEEEADSLSQRLLASGDFTTASALAFLVFILLYMPCIATVAAIGAEAGWKWAAASVVYNTTLAWFVAWIVYQIALIF